MKKKKEKEIKNIDRRFESISEFSAWLSSHKAAGYFKNETSLNSEEENELRTKFTGTQSFREANDLLLYGWHAGAERVKAAMLQTSAKSAKSTYTLSPVGFMPLAGPALAGSPRNMLRKKTVQVPAKVTTICYNISVAYDVESNDIENTAARLFNIIAGLERSGVRVELYVMMISRQSDMQLNTAVKIKSAGQPFNLLSMVYPMVHPSFIRRHMFAYTERAGVEGSGWGNYGRTVIEHDKVAKSCEALRIKTDNVFSYYDLSGKSEEEIIKMIK